MKDIRVCFYRDVFREIRILYEVRRDHVTITIFCDINLQQECMLSEIIESVTFRMQKAVFVYEEDKHLIRFGWFLKCRYDCGIVRKIKMVLRL